MKHVFRLCLCLMVLSAFASWLPTTRVHATDQSHRMAIADFENGLDPRWSQWRSSPDITIGATQAAWTPPLPDNINYWNVTSDIDAVNEYADQILSLPDINLASYDRLAVLFYTDVYAGGQLTAANGKIDLIIDDRSAGYTILGTAADTGTNQNMGRWSLAGVPAAARDQIYQIRVRVYESGFGAVAPAGQTLAAAKTQRTHLYSIAAEAASDAPRLTVADYEGGVDSRSTLFANGMTAQGPWAAPLPSSPLDADDDMVYWDIFSDNDGVNDYVDYHLQLVPQNWEPFDQLKIKFFTWCDAGCNNQRSITPILHDADGGYTILGTFSDSARDAEGRITINLAAIANRDQIDDLTIRVHESYFGGTGVAGARQRTHIYDVEAVNSAARAFPTLTSSSGVSAAITRPDNYDYAPSVMKDGSTYKMWWCTSRVNPMAANNNDHVWDVIRYAESTDGVTWNLAGSQVVLTVTPSSPETNGASDGHVCDPSVIKVNGTYYMYYAAGGPSDLQCATIARITCGANYLQATQVFLATSTNGVTWTKYLDPATSKPKPVVANAYVPQALYGIGQPTAFYLNGRFYLYYTDAEGDRTPALSDDWKWTRLKISYNGFFEDSGPGSVVFSYSDLVPTYHRDLGLFVGINAFDLGETSPATPTKFTYYFSHNGTRWNHDDPGTAPSIQTSANTADVTHNAGILTDPQGLAFGNKNQSTLSVYFAHGGNIDSRTWDIKKVDIQLTQ